MSWRTSEPCPFCGNRVQPIKTSHGSKKCPLCGGEWFESGGFAPKTTMW